MSDNFLRELFYKLRAFQEGPDMGWGMNSIWNGLTGAQYGRFMESLMPADYQTPYDREREKFVTETDSPQYPDRVPWDNGIDTGVNSDIMSKLLSDNRLADTRNEQGPPQYPIWSAGQYGPPQQPQEPQRSGAITFRGKSMDVPLAGQSSFSYNDPNQYDRERARAALMEALKGHRRLKQISPYVQQFENEIDPQEVQSATAALAALDTGSKTDYTQKVSQWLMQQGGNDEYSRMAYRALGMGQDPSKLGTAREGFQLQNRGYDVELEKINSEIERAKILAEQYNKQAIAGQYSYEGKVIEQENTNRRAALASLANEAKQKADEIALITDEAEKKIRMVELQQLMMRLNELRDQMMGGLQQFQQLSQQGGSLRDRINSGGIE